MRRFGTVDTFIEVGDRAPKIGRLVANREFLLALLRYGTFDEFEIFCPTRPHIEMLAAVLERELLDPALLSRISLSHQVCLGDRLREHAYDVFHVGGWYHYLPALATLRAQLDLVGKFSISGTIHSLNAPDVGVHARRVLEAPLDHTDAIVCSSNHGRDALSRHLTQAARDIQARYGQRPPSELQLVTIPLGIDDTEPPTIDRADARRELEIPAHAVVLLYFGRISVPNKGDLTPLLYGFRSLLDRVSDEVYLVIAGGSEGQSLAHLEDAARSLRLRSRVRFVPDADRELKTTLFAAADIFVSPIDNVQETFGITLLEAMAAELPVVASDFSGYRELVHDGKTGLLVPTLATRPPDCTDLLWDLLEPQLTGLLAAQCVAVDVESLCRALERLIAKPELRRCLGAQGRARVLDHFTWKGLIPRYEALWEQLALMRQSSAATPKPSDSPPTPDRKAPLAHRDRWGRSMHTRDHQLEWKALTPFDRYATRALAPTDTFEVSELGEQSAVGVVPWPRPYGELGSTWSDALCAWLFEQLRTEAHSWEELRTNAQHAGHVEDCSRIHLIWLFKHGLVRLVTN